MKKRNKLLIIILTCVLVACVGLTVVNTVIIAAWKDKIADMEWEIATLEDAMIEGMGLLAWEHEGLPFRVYVPQGAQDDEKYPLVLYLHGAGARGDDNRAHMMGNFQVKTLVSEESQAQYPCVVLAPQCPENQGWVTSQDEDFSQNTEAVMGMLEQVCAAYPVDRSRIYITGVSMGGFGTWGMLRAYPDYFAAAVPICGGWLRDDDPAHVSLYRDVPIWAFHGALDTAVPVERSRDMVEALEALDGNVRYTEYPQEGHSIAARVYFEPELFPWLFAQVRETQNN